MVASNENSLKKNLLSRGKVKIIQRAKRGTENSDE
jgi:hypothetical protein